MTKYVWKDGRFVCKKTGEPMNLPFEGQITTPYVRGDLPAYQSPVTGKMVDGRSARREDLARTGCREVDPSEYTPQYRNKKFCLKHGVNLDKYVGDE